MIGKQATLCVKSISWFGSIFSPARARGSQSSNYPMRGTLCAPRWAAGSPTLPIDLLFCVLFFSAFIHLMPVRCHHGAPVPESKSDVPSGLKPRRRRSSEQAPSLAISLRLFFMACGTTEPDKCSNLFCKCFLWLRWFLESFWENVIVCFSLLSTFSPSPRSGCRRRRCSHLKTDETYSRERKMITHLCGSEAKPECFLFCY